MNRLALTGGIACGKSTVSRLLEERGWKIIDTDAIAWTLLQRGTSEAKKVVDAFGKTILTSDSSINRAALGQIVFEDSEKRELLNSILHPRIREIWLAEFQACLEEKKSVPALVAIPLLFETGARARFDSVLCVACSRAVQIERLLKRDLSAKQAEGRMAAQLPVEEKAARSNFLIWNDGTMELLKAQVERFDTAWKSETPQSSLA